MFGSLETISVVAVKKGVLIIMPGYNTMEFYCDREECGNAVESLGDKYCHECECMEWGIDPKRDAYIALEEKRETLWREFMNQRSESDLRKEYVRARLERWVAFLEARGEDPDEGYPLGPGECLRDTPFRRTV